ncbi:gliding motility-associated protein GldC [Chitinophaga skermanii]|uniref:Gliding motility-associated protein GldC n=1 Tax=Chitinophaga skermanii TaxID=331697 RepID=A0A327R0T8_9BACT|nr:gliding motility protein GldC [Chitinophaga skermanii]RAJ10469.1 gliding motility-associated protein GldC [Chitinophaga skermanii]
MGKTSNIEIKVTLDDQRVPEKLEWSAEEGSERLNQAKAMMLAFWDGADKTALRIDLWTKSMMVDEMADFFFQTMMTMADTYKRATPYHDMAEDLKQFANQFYKKFQDKLKQEEAEAGQKGL